MIDFIDLKEQYNLLEGEIVKSILNVLQHGKYIMGPEVEELEQKLCKYVGVKNTIACSNGTEALLMPLMAWGIGPGDAVFTTPFTFIATAEVIALIGATPVFVDINPDSFNIDPQKLQVKIEEVLKDGKLVPKVIVPVDLFGLPCEYDEIGKIADKYNLKILEDAAQGFGGEYKGKKAGSFGDAAGTSFFPAKPLGCYGDGGAIFTDDDELASIIRSLRVHGQGDNKYQNIRIGLNGRLDTLQAAILLPKLKAFKKELNLRNSAASRYTLGLKGYLKTPEIPEGFLSSWAQYSVLARDWDIREKIRQGLKLKGIPTAVYYPIPLHLQKAFEYLNYSHGDFPVCEDISSRIFSIPMHPYLKAEVMDEIIETIIDSCQK